MNSPFRGAKVIKMLYFTTLAKKNVFLATKILPNQPNRTPSHIETNVRKDYSRATYTDKQVLPLAINSSVEHIGR